MNKIIYLFLFVSLTTRNIDNTYCNTIYKKNNICLINDVNKINIQLFINLFTKYKNKIYLKYKINFPCINLHKNLFFIENNLKIKNIKIIKQKIIYSLLNNNIKYISNDSKINKNKKIINLKNIKYKFNVLNLYNFLLHKKQKTYISKNKQFWYLTIELIPNCLNKKIYKYIKYTYKSAYKYNIDQSLILAITQTESDFKPFSISSSQALGLMQIIKYSSGKDIFKKKGKKGNPNKKYLLKPKNNIDIGSAYIALLQNIYFKKITDYNSKKYLIISAYNSGISSLLEIFSKNSNNAIKTINNLQSKEIYNNIYRKHSSIELRYYLLRVNILQKKFKL